MAKVKTLYAATSVLCLVCAAQARAADPVADPAPAVADAAGSDIVVTARKREERLLDVPAQITAFTSEQLARSSVTTLDNLAQMTPGLTNQSLGGTYQAPVIRGIAQINQTGIVGNVGVFIDGIYLNNRSGQEFSFLDADRIEVVKGPQSALYGRNTFSGAINYVTQSAVIGRFDGSLSTDIGDYGLRQIKGSFNIPLSDIMALRVFGGVGTFDGTIKNIADGKDIGGWNKRYTYGGQLLVKPIDELTLTAFYEKTYTNEDQAPFVTQPSTMNNCGSLALGPNGVRYTLFCGKYKVPDTVDVNTNPAHGLIGYSQVAYGKADYDFGFATLSGKVGYYYSAFSQLNDQNGDPTAVTKPLTPGSSLSQQILQQAVTTGTDEYSGDLRLASNGNGRFKWFIGYTYYNNQINDQITVNYATLNNINNYVFSYGRTTTVDEIANAAYGQASYDITDKINFGAEGRYTRDELDFYNSLDHTVHGHVKYNYITPKFTLQFKPSREINIYASAGKGYKVGGFNVNAPNTPQFTYKPETNWTYEFGTKASLFNGKLFAQADVFYIDWDNIQVQTNIASTQVAIITNNKGATSKGVELDLTYKPVRGLTLHGGGSYSDPKYKSGTIDGELLAACGEIVGTLVFQKGCTANAGGNDLQRISKWQAVASVDYTHGIAGNWAGYFHGDYSYTSAKHYNSLDTSSQGSIKLVNTRIGVTSGLLDLSFWVKNLFDSRYLERATELGSGNIDGGAASGVIGPRLYPGERRTLGITASMKFGQ